MKINKKTFSFMAILFFLPSMTYPIVMVLFGIFRAIALDHPNKLEYLRESVLFGLLGFVASLVIFFPSLLLFKAAKTSLIYITLLFFVSAIRSLINEYPYRGEETMVVYFVLLLFVTTATYAIGFNLYDRRLNHKPTKAEQKRSLYQTALHLAPVILYVGSATVYNFIQTKQMYDMLSLLDFIFRSSAIYSIVFAITLIFNKSLKPMFVVAPIISLGITIVLYVVGNPLSSFALQLTIVTTVYTIGLRLYDKRFKPKPPAEADTLPEA